ncbi:MAG: hypothetical protein AAFU67_06895 [Bacteroidota bacterium]
MKLLGQSDIPPPPEDEDEGGNTGDNPGEEEGGTDPGTIITDGPGTIIDGGDGEIIDTEETDNQDTDTEVTDDVDTDAEEVDIIDERFNNRFNRFEELADANSGLRRSNAYRSTSAYFITQGNEEVGPEVGFTEVVQDTEASYNNTSSESRKDVYREILELATQEMLDQVVIFDDGPLSNQEVFLINDVVPVLRNIDSGGAKVSEAWNGAELIEVGYDADRIKAIDEILNASTDGE